MPIKSSPAPLAISEIVTEFGDDAGGSDSLSEYYKGGANVNDVATNSNIPTSGAIDIGDFYGAGNAVSVAASAGTNIDVAPLFGSPDTFTNAVSKILTIAAPIQIVGNNVALTVPSSMAGTLDIQNAGNIIGSRGNGGNAGGAAAAGSAGGAGGAAISVQKAGVTITNSGTISGGGGGGGGGAGGANSSSTNTTNFGAANYSNSRGWRHNFGPHGSGGGATGFYDGVNFGPSGTNNTTQISQTSGGGSGTMNRGNLHNNAGQPAGSHSKQWNVGGGSYQTVSNVSGGAGGGGGNGYGYQGDNTTVVNAESGASGSSPGGANGGAGGGAGAAGTAGSNSPAANGGAGGAGGNSVTSPGSVNYTVSNSGTINGTQG